MGRDAAAREHGARLLGVAVAVLAMAAAWHAIGWPAPGVSVGLGLLVYVLWRGGRPAGGGGA